MSTPKLPKAKAKELLQKAIAAIPELQKLNIASDEFTKWRRDTEVAIENIFSADSRHLKDFKSISYLPPPVMAAVARRGDPPSRGRDTQPTYLQGLNKAKAILESMIGEIDTYWKAEKLQLRVSKGEADKSIEHFLTRGNEFQSAPFSGPQLEETERRLNQWSEDVKEALEDMFTTTEIAERFIATTLDTSQAAVSDEEKHLLAVKGTWELRIEWLKTLLTKTGIYAPISTNDDKPNALVIIQRLCARFHTVARQLRQRHDSRPTLDVSDEYDVQDLLHSLLRIYFDDIREEEYTPSYAGGASRIDFLLKQEQIIIEVKKTRPTLKAKELGEQLIVDIARYEAHPDCKLLYCFVYDPDGYIKNPQGIENDLSRSEPPFPVIVFIGPKTH